MCHTTKLTKAVFTVLPFCVYNIKENFVSGITNTKERRRLTLNLLHSVCPKRHTTKVAVKLQINISKTTKERYVADNTTKETSIFIYVNE